MIMRKNFLRATVLGVCLIAAGALLGSIGRLAEPVEAPTFSLADIEGKSLSLKDYKGKVVLLMFWATWCGPCRMEIPHLIELQNTYGKKGFAVLALSVSDQQQTIERMTAFVKQAKINYRVALKGESVATQYGGMESIPTAFLIDRSGKLRVKFVGAHPKEDIEREMLALLTSPSESRAREGNGKSKGKSS